MYEEEIKKILEVSKGKFYVNQEEFFDAQNSIKSMNKFYTRMQRNF